MPRGTYLHLDGGIEERFQCAPGPAGWRYVGERADGGRVDLTTDSRWCPARVEIGMSGRLVRAGVVGREVLWVHHAGSSPPVERAAEAVGLLGDSPGFLVAVARSLRLGERGGDPGGPDNDGGGHGRQDPEGPGGSAGPGAQRVTADVRLVRLAGPSLAALTVTQRWRLVEVSVHETELRPLPVEHYEVTDLATAETERVALAGDVVLAAPGIELAALESPPNLPA